MREGMRWGMRRSRRLGLWCLILAAITACLVSCWGLSFSWPSAVIPGRFEYSDGELGLSASVSGKISLPDGRSIVLDPDAYVEELPGLVLGIYRYDEKEPEYTAVYDAARGVGIDVDLVTGIRCGLRYGGQELDLSGCDVYVSAGFNDNVWSNTGRDIPDGQAGEFAFAVMHDESGLAASLSDEGTPVSGTDAWLVLGSVM